MKGCDSATFATLAAGQLKVIDLYTFTLSGGNASYYFTTHQVPVKNNGITYQTGLIIRRGDVQQSLGITVDNMSLTCSPQASAGVQIAGFPFLTAAQMRLFDGARVLWSRLFLDSWTDTVRKKVDFFQGRVNEVNLGRLTAQFDINSDIEMLNVQMPRNLIQKTCLHEVYDPGCGLSRAAFTDSIAVAAGSTVLKVQTASTRPENYFTFGRLTFTSGALAGIPLAYFVKKYGATAGSFEFFRPLPAVPSVGDTFQVSAGCNNLLATCSNSNSAVGPAFNNRGRFKAMPFVPVPETLYDGGTTQPSSTTTLGQQGGASTGSQFSSGRGARGFYKP
jgi:uncharacterized phage protein (TIGR02218 family)